MAFNNFPYVDSNDFNIDWLIKTVKAIKEVIDRSTKVLVGTAVTTEYNANNCKVSVKYEELD